jgi:hypothetical protein
MKLVAEAGFIKVDKIEQNCLRFGFQLLQHIRMSVLVYTEGDLVVKTDIENRNSRHFVEDPRLNGYPTLLQQKLASVHGRFTTCQLQLLLKQEVADLREQFN